MIAETGVLLNNEKLHEGRKILIADATMVCRGGWEVNALLGTIDV